jgi:hypothetical protein
MGIWHGDPSLPLIAGTISTSIYMMSNLPMLRRAMKTRNLKSYSFSTLVLCNVADAVHWVYVAHLPFGPIWFLHGFTSVSTALMFVWYLKYERRSAHLGRSSSGAAAGPAAPPVHRRRVHSQVRGWIPQPQLRAPPGLDAQVLPAGAQMRRLRELD